MLRLEKSVGSQRNERSTRQLATYSTALLPLILALLLYGPEVDHPYFWDDVPHYDFVRARSYLEIWTNARELAYYRPLTFTLYKPLFEWLPPGATTLPHLLVVLIHAANGWLVGLLARRLLVGVQAGSGRGKWIGGVIGYEVGGLVAGLLFVAYPFAALPVAHLAAMMHPLVTMLTLGTVLAALEYTRPGHRRWLAVAVGLALMAPFAHEVGIMAGIIASTVLVLTGRGQIRRDWRLLVVLPSASALFMPIWLLVPRSPSATEWLGPGGILASLAFFVQGPSFPVQPLARLAINALSQAGTEIYPTVVGLPWWNLAAIWGVAIVILVPAVIMLRRAGHLFFLAIALAWAFLVALPAIVALPFPYISVSQRLLYAGGPPAALLWATLCIDLAEQASRPLSRSAIALGLTALLAAVPVAYVRREAALQERALHPLAQLVEVAREHAAERHLVVNTVNWLNYKQPWYPLGHEGISVSADYVDLGALIRLNSGNNTQFRAMTYPPIKAQLERYYYSTVGEENAWDQAALAGRVSRFDRVWLTTYSDTMLATEEAGSVGRSPGQTADQPEQYLAGFEGRVFLVEVQLGIRDRRAVAELNWQYMAAYGEATVFVHLLGCEGQLLAQDDGLPLGGMLAFDGLTPGTRIKDVRHLTLEAAGNQEECYRLHTGLYLPDGSRVMARKPDGSILTDQAVSLTLDTGGHR
jgi:hypothetical protein